MAEARALAQALASKAPVAVRYILDAVDGGLEMPFADAQDYEATLFGLALDHRGHARRHARVSREAQTRVQRRAEPSQHADSHRCVARITSSSPTASKPARAQCFAKSGVADEDVETFQVPGAYELAQAAQRVAESGQWSGVVCLGCLIRGRDAALRLHRAAPRRTASCAPRRTTGVPMAFGVLTTNTADEALARAGDGPSNKGREAAAAALRWRASTPGSTRGEAPRPSGRATPAHDQARRRGRAARALPR